MHHNGGPGGLSQGLEGQGLSLSPLCLARLGTGPPWMDRWKDKGRKVLGLRAATIYSHDDALRERPGIGRRDVQAADEGPQLRQVHMFLQSPWSFPVDGGDCLGLTSWP